MQGHRGLYARPNKPVVSNAVEVQARAQREEMQIQHRRDVSQQAKRMHCSYFAISSSVNDPSFTRQPPKVVPPKHITTPKQPTARGPKGYC